MSEYITQEGLILLQKKMNKLLTIDRPQVVKQIASARELGDLKENAEYHAARERQRHIDNELTHLRNRLSKLQAIDSSKIAKDAVRFGAYVTLKDLNNKEILKYRLVGIDETDFKTNDWTLISIASPIGKSMIGKKKNEDFVVKAPIGDRNFKILSIE